MFNKKIVEETEEEDVVSKVRREKVMQIKKEFDEMNVKRFLELCDEDKYLLSSAIPNHYDVYGFDDVIRSIKTICEEFPNILNEKIDSICRNRDILDALYEIVIQHKAQRIIKG